MALMHDLPGEGGGKGFAWIGERLGFDNVGEGPKRKPRML